MHLTIFNGSPRAKKSNTEIIMNHFINGFCSQPGHTATMLYLVDRKKKSLHIEALKESDVIIIAMPLYCYTMPSIVKEFLESIPDPLVYKDKKIGFIIQSGFQEYCHSVSLVNYFDSIARFLPCQYLGSMAKGGVEGIQMKPAYMTKGLFTQFRKLGARLASDGIFDPSIKKAFAKPYQYSKFQLFLYKYVFSKMADAYWNQQLKQNNCYEKRYDKPYL